MKRFTVLAGIVCAALLLIAPCPSNATPIGVDIVFYEAGPIHYGDFNPSGVIIQIGISSMSIIKTSDGSIMASYPVSGGMLEFSAPFVPGSYSSLGSGGFRQQLGTIAAGGSVAFISGTVNGISLPGAVSAAFSGTSGSFSMTDYNRSLLAVTGGGPIINGTLSDPFAALFSLDNTIKGSGALTFNYWDGSLQSGSVTLQFLQTPVPIPSALALLGPALIGLFGMRKRFKR